MRFPEYMYVEFPDGTIRRCKITLDPELGVPLTPGLDSPEWEIVEPVVEQPTETTRWEVEYQQPYYGHVPAPWCPLSDHIGGIKDGFGSLEEAQRMVNVSIPAIAKVDKFFEPLKYRVVEVTRKEVTRKVVSTDVT